MNFIERAWKGEAKLWKVFWLGVVIPQIGGVILGIVHGGREAAIRHGEKLDIAAVQASAAELVYTWWWMGLWCVYYLLLEVCIWRCTPNASHKAWGYAARILILILALFALGGFLGALSPKEAAIDATPPAVSEPYESQSTYE